jgi:hypothetical protein
MEIKILILVALILAMLWIGKGESKHSGPRWAEHLRGWQIIFAAAAFVAVLLMMLNPEFLALGLLGDTAFFDVLVLAFGLQFRNAAFWAEGNVRRVITKVQFSMLRSLQRDYAMVVVSLAPIASAAVAVCKIAVKLFHEHDHLLT